MAATLQDIADEVNAFHELPLAAQARIDEVVRAVRDGTSTSLVLTGPPATGKQTFVRAIHEAATSGQGKKLIDAHRLNNGCHTLTQGMRMGNMLLWLGFLALATFVVLWYLGMVKSPSASAMQIPWTGVTFQTPATMKNWSAEPAAPTTTTTSTSTTVKAVASPVPLEYGRCQYCKDALGTVRLRGLMAYTGAPGSTVVLFKLPATCSPTTVTNALIFAVTSSDKYGEIRIGANGDVIYYEGKTDTWISLDGIQFQP